MSDADDPSPYYRRLGHRLLTAALGVSLCALGVYVWMFGSVSLFWRIVAGVVLVSVGINAVASSRAARESWLSRVGPLP
jgi:uncharacterized membrane protein HdeD (DUF308 family)